MFCGEGQPNFKNYTRFAHTVPLGLKTLFFNQEVYKSALSAIQKNPVNPLIL